MDGSSGLPDVCKKRTAIIQAKNWPEPQNI